MPFLKRLPSDIGRNEAPNVGNELLISKKTRTRNGSIDARVRKELDTILQCIPPATTSIVNDQSTGSRQEFRENMLVENRHYQA